MFRQLLRPQWLAFHLLVIAMIVVMVNLAFWQIDRHNERQEFNATLTARFDEPVVTLESLLGADPADIEWRTVQVIGTYLSGADVSVVNISQDGRAGFDPVSALVMPDGRVVLINRGFLPLATPFPAAPSGEVTVTGTVRSSAQRRTGQIADPSDGVLTEVQRIDIPRLDQQIDGDLVDVYVELLASDPADSPALSRIATPDFTTGPHLSYAVQWFIFSALAGFGWVVVVRRGLAKSRAADEHAEQRAG
jgi:cytochrome oxidase assembly protein ShyY1